MTTAQFIQKYLEGTTKKDSCSSVWGEQDYSGERKVYSYGRHYPLAVIIDGKAYVNTRGYSNSTSKHIGWAMQATAQIVGYDNVHGVPLTNGNGLNKRDIQESARRGLDSIHEQMTSKKRKDTQVYKNLEHQEVRLLQALQAVTA